MEGRVLWNKMFRRSSADAFKHSRLTQEDAVWGPCQHLPRGTLGGWNLRVLPTSSWTPVLPLEAERLRQVEAAPVNIAAVAQRADFL